MRSKYVVISGFAFDEEGDMAKLSQYAADGWILEKISGGIFYKLKKDKPQNIIYSLDYQQAADAEYYDMFNEAGWKHVLTLSEEIHIFSAAAGTKPIYSDKESEREKYMSSKKISGIGTLVTFILGLIMVIAMTKLINVKVAIFILVPFFVIDVMFFAIFILVYVAYVSRTSGNLRAEKYTNLSFSLVFGVVGIVFVCQGISIIIAKPIWGLIELIIGIFELYASIHFFKIRK